MSEAIIEGENKEVTPAAEEQTISSPHVETEPQQKMVPLSALEDERHKRQRLEHEHHALISELNKRNQNVQSGLHDLEDSDLLTVGDFKKISKSIKEEVSTSLKELKITQKYPDYVDVISNYLPEVIKEHPNLRDTLLKTQDYELAYLLAKNSDNYRKDKQKEERSIEAEKIVKNASSSGSLASIGTATPISQIKRYKDMTDEEFKREVAKNMGY